MKAVALTITELVLHGIPGHGSPTDEIELSDQTSELNDGQRQYIQSRLRGALARRARPVLEEVGQPLPAAIHEILTDPDSLVRVSRDIAALLVKAQPSISPPGIVVVAHATLGGEQAVVVAKLEHELGVRAQQTVLPNGNKTFDVQLIKDLLFTQQSQVFKVAAFTRPEDGELLGGFMVDNQSGTYGVAQFFLHDFLGCVLAERSDVLTEGFFSASEKWINNLQDPEKRARYTVALISEMQSQSSDVSSTAFATRSLDLSDRDDYEAFIQGAGTPSRVFDKDTSLVQNRLNQVRVDTVSGVAVIAQASSYEDGTVSVSNEDSGVARITVMDRIQHVSGRGRAPRTSRDSLSQIDANAQL